MRLILKCSSYHCEALGIIKCTVLGSCSLYKHCAHWCVDLNAPGGAVCADGALESIEARGETQWDDDATSKYM